ncbi:hypothetical protein QA601_10585 [Chitinispirillales bacterium ANBcel5]|uniref:hypothetical protein n=1 Tax=Cellulosispirillum alkaliphilum TaxID=3039283 RepID=UPI002A57580B|nr:hypothetical protein [Chitinispirillales bacterium ANBcel5]
MICKILSLPFWLLSKVLGTFSSVLKLILSLLGKIVAFAFNRGTGTVFGALIGLILGRKHVGIKLFNRKKKLLKTNK